MSGVGDVGEILQRLEIGGHGTPCETEEGTEVVLSLPQDGQTVRVLIGGEGLARGFAGEIEEIEWPDTVRAPEEIRRLRDQFTALIRARATDLPPSAQLGLRLAVMKHRAKLALNGGNSALVRFPDRPEVITVEAGGRTKTLQELIREGRSDTSDIGR